MCNVHTLISFSSGLPIFCADNGQAYLTLFIDVWVVDFCFETNFWWFEWIFGRKIDFNAECTFRIWRIFLQDMQWTLEENTNMRTAHNCTKWQFTAIVGLKMLWKSIAFQVYAHWIATKMIMEMVFCSESREYLPGLSNQSMTKYLIHPLECHETTSNLTISSHPTPVNSSE